MTTISNQTELEAARRRQAELQRTAGSDPEKQRELRELNEKIDAYQRANPAGQGRASTSAESSSRRATPDANEPDLSGQSVYDPHNQNNVGRGINDPNRDQRTDSPAPNAPQQAPGTPGSSSGSTGNR